MRTRTVGLAGRRPLRWGRGDERGPGVGLRSGELAAGLATAAVAGQLLFALPTLVAAATLVALGRVSRWRPHWLAAATAGIVVWLCGVGPAAAVVAFTAASHQLASFLLAAAIQPRLLAHPGVAARVGAWWPAALAVALLAACGEAWLVLWLGWWRPGAQWQARWWWRPGLVAAVRRRMSAAALAAGHTATTRGCALGVAPDTGKLAGFRWAEAGHGVLLVGANLDLVGLAMTCAALRRRMTVVILECAGSVATTGAQLSQAAVTERVGQLARSLGVPVTAGAVACPARAIGRAIRRRETVLIEPALIDTRADAGRPGVTDLAGVLTELRDLGLRADCFTWISGVEFVDPALLGELLALGPLTGTIVAVSTTSSAAAAHLASAASVVVVGHPVGTELSQALAARLRDGYASRPIQAPHRLSSSPRRPGEVTMLVFPPGSHGSPPAITNCRVVPILLDHLR